MKKIVQATALAASMLTAGAVIAATDGAVGGISTGTLDITVTVNDEVRISGLSDVSGIFDGVNDIQGTSSACVYRNGGGATGAYNITATGDGGGGAFTIVDGPNPPVAYTVEWDDRSGGGFTALATGVALTAQSTTETTTDDCGGGDTADVRVTVPAANLLASPAGSLFGVLTLEVAPE